MSSAGLFFLTAILGADLVEATDARDPDADRVRAHLSLVLELLTARDSTRWSEPQRKARADRLELLRRYVESGRFPHNHVKPGRVPVFIDPHGTPCAVAALLIGSGRRALAERIAAHDNLVYAEQIDEPELTAWAHDSGLTLEELALIQPSYPARDRRWDVDAEVAGGDYSQLASARDLEGDTAASRYLLRYAPRGQAHVSQYLLRELGADPNSSGVFDPLPGWSFDPSIFGTALAGAVWSPVAEADKLDVLRVLLQAGADPERPLRIFGTHQSHIDISPLYLATLFRERMVVALLLDFGAKPEAPGFVTVELGRGHVRLPWDGRVQNWKHGETPTQLARRLGDEGLTAELARTRGWGAKLSRWFAKSFEAPLRPPPSIPAQPTRATPPVEILRPTLKDALMACIRELEGMGRRGTMLKAGFAQAGNNEDTLRKLLVKCRAELE